MKKLGILVVLLMTAVAFSGCVDQSPETKAKAIADNKPEIKLISRMMDSMANMDKCTKDRLMDGIQRYSDVSDQPIQFPPGFEAQMDQIISQAGEWSQTCHPRMTSKVEKESENIYLVSYSIETGDDPSCSMVQIREDVKVRVNISDETATIEGMAGSQNEETMEKMEETMDIMGECTGVMMFFFRLMPMTP